jgi:hypothetical protein
MTDNILHPCLICQSYSQVSIYHYAHQLKLQSELTFVHLRYFLGGDRPSQTTHYILLFNNLEFKNFKSGFSYCKSYFINSFLPLRLHKKAYYSIYDYSKGARGLSV